MFNLLLLFFAPKYTTRLAEEIEREVGHEKEEAMEFLQVLKAKLDPKNEGKVKLLSFKKLLNNREWDDFLEEESESCIEKLVVTIPPQTTGIQAITEWDTNKKGKIFTLFENGKKFDSGKKYFLKPFV